MFLKELFFLNKKKNRYSCIYLYSKWLKISGTTGGTEKIMEYLIKNPGGFWVCKACGFNEKHKSNILTHVESKHYSPWYPCRGNCGKTFKLRNSRCQHEKYCVFE